MKPSLASQLGVVENAKAMIAKAMAYEPLVPPKVIPLQRVLRISRTPRPSFRRNNKRRVTPSA